MLSSIIDIGKSLSSSNSADVSNFIKMPATKEKKGKNIVKCLIGILDFDTVQKKALFRVNNLGLADPFAVAKEYKYFGNFKGNRPQWSLTTDNLGYLLTDSLENLRKMSDGILYQEISKIVDFFYTAVDFKNHRGTMVLDLTKVDFSNIPGLDVSSLYPSKNGNFSKIDMNKSDYEKKIAKLINEYLIDDKNSFIMFWTVFVDGNMLSSMKEYDLVSTKMLAGNSDQWDQKGICSICGKEGEISYKSTKNLQLLKFYITDKISFASNISEDGFRNNMGICQSCYGALATAEKFLLNKMQKSIGGMPLYLIPSIPNVIIQQNNLEFIANTIDVLLNYKKVLDLEDELNNLLNDYSEGTNAVSFGYSLTLLFQNKKSNSSSDFKIYKIMEEIPKTRIEEIFETLKKSCLLYNRYFSSPSGNEESGFVFNLTDAYYHLQLRSDKRAVDRKAVLDIISYIVAGRPLSKGEIVKRLLGNVRLDFLKLESKNPYFSLCNSVTKKLVFMSFLVYDGLISTDLGGWYEMSNLDEMETGLMNGVMDETVKRGMEYLKAAKYNPLQRGLFWIGYLSGRVMLAQYKRLKSQPLLDKIGFKGMSKHDLIQYDIELLESMKNYNLLGVPNLQKIHFLAHFYMDDVINSEGYIPTREEIPFYIMAGIAYEYYTRIGKEDKNEEAEERAEEEALDE